jgi:hypothetical protein
MRPYKNPSTEELADPIIDFCARVNGGVAHTRVVVWWSRHEKRFLLGLHCGQVLLRALYLVAFSRLGQPGGLAHCENCGKWFKRGHKKEKRFCNSNCRSAFTMRRLRAKARRSVVQTSRKEQYGTTQTR